MSFRFVYSIWKFCKVCQTWWTRCLEGSLNAWWLWTLIIWPKVFAYWFASSHRWAVWSPELLNWLSLTVCFHYLCMEEGALISHSVWHWKCANKKFALCQQLKHSRAGPIPSFRLQPKWLFLKWWHSGSTIILLLFLNHRFKSLLVICIYIPSIFGTVWCSSQLLASSSCPVVRSSCNFGF